MFYKSKFQKGSWQSRDKVPKVGEKAVDFYTFQKIKRKNIVCVNLAYILLE